MLTKTHVFVTHGVGWGGGGGVRIDTAQSLYKKPLYNTDLDNTFPIDSNSTEILSLYNTIH